MTSGQRRMWQRWRRECAYHEAGHLVAGFELGFEPRRISIHPNDPLVEFRHEWPTDSVIRATCLRLMAGWTAHAMSNRRVTYFEAAMGLGRHDVEAVRRIIDGHGVRLGLDWYALELEARRFVRQHWREIEDVAEALLCVTASEGYGEAAAA